MTPTDGRFEALTRSPAFRRLDADDQVRLAEAFDSVSLAGGKTLMVEGEEADSMYLVDTGRLRVFVHRDRADVPIGEIGPGEVVGEMSLLSDRNRSATVIAIRDSSLLKLSKEAFNDLVLTHPDLLLELTRLLVARLDRTNRAVGVETVPRSIVLLPVDGSLDVEEFTEAFVSELGDGAVRIDRKVIGASLGPEAPDTPIESQVDTDIARWMHHAETENEWVVYVADLGYTPWTRRCLRQADRVLLVGSGGTGGERTEAESRILWESRSAVRPQVDLVIVHPKFTAQPAGTSGLVAHRDIEQHHHVRRGSWDGIDRLVRVISGKSVGLVLGGGGARAYAHLGVIKALFEQGIPIDFVGGTSAGASVAAGVALGWDIDTSIANAKYLTVDRGSFVDFTVPAVALSKGEVLTTGLRDVLGETQIEDLWIPFFCVSTDLTDGVARIHTRGSLWRAIRSTFAIPGVFPPMRDDNGHVLVDGGVVNNLPVDVMVGFGVGSTILAADLRAKAELPAESLPPDGVLSGWGIIASRLNPGSPRPHVPMIIDVLLRSNEVASSPHGVDADLMFRPPVDTFGMLDFSSWEELVDVGYRHAIEVLDAWPGTASLKTSESSTTGHSEG